MNNNYVISHIDMDGVGCIIIGFLFGLITNKKDLAMLDYDDLHTDETKTQSDVPLKDDADYVYYTDLNIDPIVYEALTSYYGVDNVLFFDHHQESLTYADKPNIFVDERRCGTRLFYDYLRKGKRVPAFWDEFVHLVDVYDRWDLDNPLREKAENLNRVLYRMINYNARSVYKKYQPFITYQLEKLRDPVNHKQREFFFTDFEKHQIELAREKEDTEYRYAMENVQERVDSQGRRFLLYHGASKISYVCNRMLRDRPDVTYVVAANTWSDKPFKREISGKVSVRAQPEGDFDCNELDGVAGHKAAAGGMLDAQFLKDLLHNKYNEIGYQDNSPNKG